MTINSNIIIITMQILNRYFKVITWQKREQVLHIKMVASLCKIETKEQFCNAF